jgi:hypothetical protein
VIKIIPINKKIAPPPARDPALFRRIAFGGYIPGLFNARRLWTAPTKKAMLTRNTMLVKIPIPLLSFLNTIPYIIFML